MKAAYRLEVYYSLKETSNILYITSFEYVPNKYNFSLSDIALCEKTLSNCTSTVGLLVLEGINRPVWHRYN